MKSIIIQNLKKHAGENGYVHGYIKFLEQTHVIPNSIHTNFRLNRKARFLIKYWKNGKWLNSA